MSIYQVDPSKQPAGGQDIADRSHQHDTVPQVFPEARPSYPPPQSNNPNSNLRRNQTSASRYSTHLDGPLHHTDFPVPMPSGHSAAGFAIDPTSPNPILNGQAYYMMDGGPYGPDGPYHAGYGGGYVGGYNGDEESRFAAPSAHGPGGHGGYEGHGGHGGHSGHGGPGDYAGGGYPESLLPAQAR